MDKIEPGSTDWNLLEELIQRYRTQAVLDAVEIISEQSETDE